MSSIWCQQEVLREISFINPWPIYWKMEHGSTAAITGIRCGHLAWSLHDFRHWASEETAFSISFWHFSSWQHATECCLNPKSNAINGAQLCKKNKRKQGQFSLPYLTGSRKRGKQEYVALGSRPIAACLLKITCNFQEAVTGTIRASWPNESTSKELGSECPGFASNPFSSPRRDATFLRVLQTFAIFIPVQSFASY